MFTDTCSIQNVTRDKQFGKVTVIKTSLPTPCRVEDEDLSEKNNEGSRSVYKRFYMLPPGTEIYKGDNIKTLTQRGVIITETYFEVDQIFPVGGMSPHHMEVTVSNV